MHLDFSIPPIRFEPAIDKIMKKNIRMTIVSCKRGMAENSAFISTFRPLTLEIVFNGLNTRKALKAPTLNPPSSYTPSSSISLISRLVSLADINAVGKLEVTITKSRIFQPSLI